MKKIQRNNFVLYISLIAVIILFLCICMFCFTDKKGVVKIDEVVSFLVDSKHNYQTLRCWHNEEENTYYVFLPTDTETIAISSHAELKVKIEGLSQKIEVEQLRLGEPYTCKIISEEKVCAKGRLVFMQSCNIPTLFVSTTSGTMEYINARKGNAEKGNFTIWSSQDLNVNSGKLSEISGRGNTSWTDCEKKGYKLTLSQPESLLGLSVSDTYVLTANARSNYLSNTIAFWLEENIGIENVTKAVHVDLYFNGEYAGNYILCEKIQVGEDGIDITDLEQLNEQRNEGQKPKELEEYVAKDGNSKGVLWRKNPSNITGGYLIERDVQEYYAEDLSGFVLTSGDHYVIKSPKYASEKEVEYIQNYMQEAYDAIANEDGYNPKTGKHYTDYVDEESFALKYVLEEFLAFNDAGRSSAYYYKNKDDILHAGPGWDFEGAFLGNSQYLTYLNGTMYSTDMYEKLWQHETFRTLVIDNFNEKLKPAIMLLLNQEFEEMQMNIMDSVNMDKIRWGREDFGSDCDTVEKWIADRMEFLNAHWNSGQEYVTVKVKSEWENNAYIYLHRGETLNIEQMPQYNREGYEFGGWVDEKTGETFDFEQTVTDDITLCATWISVDGSVINNLVLKIQQIIPEMCFVGLFLVASILFLYKIKRGGKVR